MLLLMPGDVNEIELYFICDSEMKKKIAIKHSWRMHKPRPRTKSVHPINYTVMQFPLRNVSCPPSNLSSWCILSCNFSKHHAIHMSPSDESFYIFGTLLLYYMVILIFVLMPGNIFFPCHAEWGIKLIRRKLYMYTDLKTWPEPFAQHLLIHTHNLLRHRWLCVAPMPKWTDSPPRQRW